MPPSSHNDSAKAKVLRHAFIPHFLISLSVCYNIHMSQRASILIGLILIVAVGGIVYVQTNSARAEAMAVTNTLQ